VLLLLADVAAGFSDFDKCLLVRVSPLQRNSQTRTKGSLILLIEHDDGMCAALMSRAPNRFLVEAKIYNWHAHASLKIMSKKLALRDTVI